MQQDILIELDMLLDSRLGVISQMDINLADRILSRGYVNRKTDNFTVLDPSFDIDEYRRRYKARDVETLKESRCTPIAVVLNSITNQLEKQQINTPLVSGITITVNIHPYRLTDEEKSVLVDMVSEYTSLTSDIKLIDLPLSNITPTYIKETYTAVFLYNFDEWLSIHRDALSVCKMPTVTMVAPALFVDKIPTQAEITHPTAGVVDPFAALEAGLLEFVGLVLIDIKYASITIPSTA